LNVLVHRSLQNAIHFSRFGGSTGVRDFVMAGDRASQNELLAALPASDLDLLRPHLRTIEMAFGQVLIEAGDTARRVFFPHGGIVSNMVRLRPGETVEVSATGREGAIGDGAALFGMPSPQAAVVRFPAQAFAIEAALFKSIVEHSATLREAIMRYQWKRMLQAEQIAACNAAHSAEARLCARLLRTRALAGSDSMLLGQDLMAQMLGVKRNTISLIAHALQQNGMIRYSRGRMMITNADELARRACECHTSGEAHVRRANEFAAIAVTPLRAEHAAH
jgi:CRP-like cAMP-binding protein